MKSLEKGLAIAVVAMFGLSTTLFAQVPQTGTEGTYPQEQQQQTLPEDQQEQWNSEEDQTTVPQDQLGDAEYNEEVEENALPEAVTSSLDELYPEHEVKKAFRGTDSSYKVKIENGDDKSVVYFDSSGQFIKSEVDDKDHKDKKNKDNDNSTDW